MIVIFDCSLPSCYLNFLFAILPDMAQYELTFILPADLAAARQKSVLSKLGKSIEKEGGKIVKEEKWGKRQFSYPLKKRREGIYFLWQLELLGEKAGEVKRMFEVEEEALRHLLIKHEAKRKS